MSSIHNIPPFNPDSVHRGRLESGRPVGYPTSIVAPDRRKVIISEGRVFVVYNADYVPRLSAYGAQDELELFALHRTNWASNKNVFLPFITRVPQYEGQLLERFALTPEIFPVERVPDTGRYQLEHGLMCAWRRMEIALVWVRRKLLSSLPTGLNLFALDTLMFPHPSHFGYWDKTYGTAYETRRVARKCREAFQVLMASVSYAVHLQRCRHLLNENVETDQWARDMEKSGVVHPTWVTDLLASSICNPDTKRVGVIVNLATCQWLHHLHLFIRVGLPVWIYFSKGEASYLEYDVVHAPPYRPTNTEMMEAHENLRQTYPWRLALIRDAPLTVDRSQDGSARNMDLHAEGAHDMVTRDESAQRCGFQELEYALTTSRKDHVDVMDEAQSHEMEVDQEVDQRELDQPTRTPRKPREPPMPEARSRQAAGESWEDFMRRREIKNVERLARETPLDRERRVNREREASKGAAPGKKGGDVFWWLKAGKYMLRKRVPKKQVDDIWERYRYQQRRFDSFRNEWDLCRQFAPNAPRDKDDYEPGVQEDAKCSSDSEDEDFEQEKDDDMLYVEDVVPPDAREITEHATCSSVDVVEGNAVPEFEEDVRRKFENVPQSVASDLLANESLVQVMQHRYGFSWNNVPYTLAHQIPLHNNEYETQWRENWTLNKRGMGHADSEVNATDEEMRQMDRLILALYSCQGNEAVIPAQIWDLNDDNHNPLRAKTNPNFTIELHQHEEYDWDPDHTTLAKSSFAVYVFVPSTQDDKTVTEQRNWFLAVTDATTALECLRRRDVTDTESMCEMLVKKGARFNTVTANTPSNVKELLVEKATTTDDNADGLGWRPKGYKPDGLDYLVYENKVRDFLMDSSRARAALMTGGIVWRLAMEFIGEDGLKSVLEGPSDRVSQNIFSTCRGKTASDNAPERFAWWDDSLTNKEMDLICGTYKVYTGKYDKRDAQKSN